jgi:hypothetical protein
MRQLREQAFLEREDVDDGLELQHGTTSRLNDGRDLRPPGELSNRACGSTALALSS